MADYGINPVFTTTDTITTTDLIRRRWLDNDYYGGIFTLKYTPTTKIKTILGGGYNIYDGDHYGEVIWARYANNTDIRERYYDNNATKTDGNLYSKTKCVGAPVYTCSDDMLLKKRCQSKKDKKRNFYIKDRKQMFTVFFLQKF